MERLSVCTYWEKSFSREAVLRAGAKLHLISFNVTLTALFWDCLDQCCQMSRHYDLQFWRFWSRSFCKKTLVLFRKYCAQMNDHQTVVRCQIFQLLKLEHVSRLDIMIFNLGHFVRKLWWLYIENTAIVVSVDSNFNLTSFFTRFFHCCLDR